MHEVVIGVDFGTSGARAVALNAMDGTQRATAVVRYPQWEAGLYCNPAVSVFRQHPVELVEAFERLIRELVAELLTVGEDPAAVRAITVATTGSTPTAISRNGLPLAFDSRFAEHPDALCLLWKDHAAEAECARIIAAAGRYRERTGRDLLAYSGGSYAAEWFWAKLYHVARHAPEVAEAALTFAEHSDWLPALLCGNSDPASWKRNRCGAAHKALWNAAWGGYPERAFFESLDDGAGAYLADLRDSLPADTYTANHAFGTLSEEWAKRLGLSSTVRVGVGLFDAHAAAIAGGAAPGVVAKTIGTSSAEMLAVPHVALAGRALPGIESQADGSIVPGAWGVEAGQSAFGDMFAWFDSLLRFASPGGPGTVDARASLIPQLSAAAAALEPDPAGPVVVDWFNGRRSPFLDTSVQGRIGGLTLATDAPRLYRALIEGAAFGTRAIHELLRSQGVPIDRVVLLGGIPRKSPLLVRVLADVLQTPLELCAVEHAAAHGAAVMAAVVAGVHPNLAAAQAAMVPSNTEVVRPNPAYAAVYNRLCARYTALAAAAL